MLPTFTYVFAEELFPIAKFWFNLLEVSTCPVRRFGLPSFHPLSEGLAGPSQENWLTLLGGLRPPRG